MTFPYRPGKLGKQGFTLLEVVVSLMIGAVIAGGVMGLISSTLQYKFRLNEKSAIQPILEGAAQVILADPPRAMEGSVTLEDSPGAPTVPVSLEEIELPDGNPLKSRGTRLYRVLLTYRTGELEFSLIIPRSEGT